MFQLESKSKVKRYQKIFTKNFKVNFLFITFSQTQAIHLILKIHTLQNTIH